VIVLLFYVALMLVRFYHLSVTGYLLPDEAFYYETIVLSPPPGGFREVFVGLYSLYFGWTRQRGLASFFVAGFAFVLTWAIGSLTAFYLVIRELDIPEKYGSLMILSLPLVPVFTFLLPLMLTETMGLFFALMGLLFTLRYVRGENAWNALVSCIFFVMAYKVREPYLLLAVANLLTIILASPRRWKGILGYLAALLIVLPIPLSLTPLSFAQPGYTYLLAFVENAQQVTHQVVTQQVTQQVVTQQVTQQVVTQHVTQQVVTQQVVTQQVIHQVTQQVTQPLPSLLPQVSPGVLTGPTITIPPNLTLYVLHAFLLGLTLGYNPLFATFAIVSIALGLGAVLHRNIKRKNATVLWNSIMSITSFAVALTILIYPAAGLIPVWTSTAIRASHTSLPAFLSFRNLYRRVSPKRLTGIILLFLIVTSAQIPILITALQSNLTLTNTTVDRLSLNYRAPYFRLYQIAEHSGKTLVIVGGDPRGATTYLSLLPNVTISGIPPDENGFKSLVSRNWDTIILYDNYYTIEDPATIAFYPQYYQHIVLGTHYENFLIEPIWIDGESYALRMVKSS
jgi:hypothetical protein